MNVPRVYKREPYHPLAYIFIYFAFATGASFVYMSLSEDPTGLTMYEIVNDALGYPGNLVWGLLSMLAACATVVFYFHPKPWIAVGAASLGAGLWIYLSLLYIIAGYPEGFFAASAPNLAFWAWFAVRANWFRKNKYGNPKYDSRKSFVRSRSRRQRS